MPQFIRRLGALAGGLLTRPGPSLIDAVFAGGHADPAPPTADHGAAVRAGSRVDRLRSQRPDLVAALRSDPSSPERELAAWPPVTSPGKSCRAC